MSASGQKLTSQCAHRARPLSASLGSLRVAYDQLTERLKSCSGMTIFCDCGTRATPLRGGVLVDIFLLRIMNSNQCFN
jgi:hypothetical protein